MYIYIYMYMFLLTPIVYKHGTHFLSSTELRKFSTKSMLRARHTLPPAQASMLHCLGTAQGPEIGAAREGINRSRPRV